jgi:formate hydrogenlyase subunit 3/multisubunit Na+/H+ antiporter MnhD subunit
VTRSRAFLAAVGGLFLVVFAIPLFLVPFEWAEAFGWEVERTDLGSYFGRCLGALAVAISGQALWAARSPERHRSLFALLAAAAALLAIVHLRGLVEDSQPFVEHVETLGYAAFAGLALWARPPAPG